MIVKYLKRADRLKEIKKFFDNQGKTNVVEEQMAKDPDWDIRGTSHCPACDTYLDYCFFGTVKCECEQ